MKATRSRKAQTLHIKGPLGLNLRDVYAIFTTINN